MKINPQITEILDHFNIPRDEGLLYLLALWFNLDSSVIPEDIMKMVNFSKIITRDYEDENNPVKWLIPLFGEGLSSDPVWDWVLEYREKFMQLRDNAGGGRNACIEKMKKFFAKHPDVRKEEVMEAAELYLDEFKYDARNLKYMQNAEYFISKVQRTEEGAVKGSRLEQYIEILRRKNSEEVSKTSRFREGLM